MKGKISRITLLILLFAVVIATMLAPMQAFAEKITTTATGYTSSSDVEYVTSGKYVANWGARGETVTFLSKYAQEFYTGSYTFDTLSKVSGGSSQSNAKDSALYAQLKSLMTSAHSHQTSYGETRDQYKYTDCVGSNTSKISSFYSGKELNGKWDGGSTWNREHTWPNSKGLGGNDENDIMMLRPTSVSENSSRGNTAYGQSSGYYDPGESTRGDVARIVLYVYTRWGNTSYMWGKSGVMESMDVLLKWMAEDPVDTWEMGRNDAVQAITGTRNVFVDYPEYAWLLFGKSVPEDIATPSQNAGTTTPNPDQGGDGGGTTNPDQGGDTPVTPPTTSHAGTQSDPYTVADALAVASSLESGANSQKVYVQGKVVSIAENTGKYLKGIVLSDGNGGQTLDIYSADPQSSSDLQAKAGDTILVHGYIRVRNSGEVDMGTVNNDYTKFSIVTNATTPPDGGDGGGTTNPDGGGTTNPNPDGGGTTTPPVDTPDAQVEAFKQAVANVQSATTLEDKFSAITNALNAYNTLDSAQKGQVTTQFSALKEQVSDYNAQVSLQNIDSNNALTLAIGSASLVVALAVLAVIKRVF